MENQNNEPQNSRIENFYKISYDAWLGNKIKGIDSVLPDLDSNVSFDDFKSLLEICSYDIINKIAIDVGFLENEFFITCFEREILITNKRLFISKEKDINTEFDYYILKRIFSIDYLPKAKSIVIRLLNKNIVYENYNEYNLREIIESIKKSEGIKTEEFDLNTKYYPNDYNKPKYNSLSSNKNEREEHNIGEILNIGSLIGAVGIVFILYKIAPNANLSNFLYLIVLIIGGIIGGLIYNFLSKLK
jgi:hypothetical protein